jgi:hypothetical protein
LIGTQNWQAHSNTHLGPEVAFNSFIATSTLFLNVSYAAPIVILLIRGRKVILVQAPEFTLGGGIFGYIVNWTSVLFVLITSIVSLSTCLTW